MWEVPAHDLSVAEAQDLVEGAGLEGVTVQTLESGGDVLLRVEAETVDTAKATEISQLLAEETGSDPDEVSLNSVGPSWGDEISEKALRALIFFLIAITIYITLRFELRMAIPTLVALLHDVVITVGVYSVFGFPVTPATVIALLTILGFSIYDGIVVFDKVDENTNLVGTREDLHVRGDGRQVPQPGADAVAEHVDHGPAPRGVAAVARLVRARRHHARGVRPRAARRPVRRRLLLDLHRLADARRPQGARAPVPRHQGAPAGPQRGGSGSPTSRRGRWTPPGRRAATTATATSTDPRSAPPPRRRPARPPARRDRVIPPKPRKKGKKQEPAG